MVSRVPAQRQQNASILPVKAVGPARAATLPIIRYLGNQRRNLQRDWRTLAKEINAISMVGLLSQIPPAGEAGRFYFTTDTETLYEDNGNGDWVRIGAAWRVFFVGANFPVPAGNVFVGASASASADVIITLPQATGSTDEVVVKKLDNLGHNVVVDGPIDGGSSITIANLNDVVRFFDAAPNQWLISA